MSIRLSSRCMALAAIGLLCGCHGADEAVKSQLDELRREVARIQEANERLNQRVTSMELAAAAANNSAEPSRRARSDERPALEVVRLTPDSADGREVEASAPPAEPPDDGTRTVIQAEGDRTPTVRQVVRNEGQDKAAERAKQAYERAMRLVKDKKYDAALEALAGFLVRFPSDARADNAMYWRGECYYAKRDFVRAAEQFEGLLARFPDGNKAPDAMLKLGLSQKNLGQSAKAQETFARLRKQFPYSESAKKIPTE